jgi:hypothetical protein
MIRRTDLPLTALHVHASAAIRAAVPLRGYRGTWLARPVRFDFEDWARRTFSRWNAVTIAATILGLLLFGAGLVMASR